MHAYLVWANSVVDAPGLTHTLLLFAHADNRIMLLAMAIRFMASPPSLAVMVR